MTALPTTTNQPLQARFRHVDANRELRLQCFLTVRDAEGRVATLRIQGIDGWCIPGESMRLNESPDQAAVRVASTWFATPMQVWLERVLSFPATSDEDNRWYLVFVYAADAPAGLKGTPDTDELAFRALGEPPSPFAMSHADVWNALK